MKISNIQILLFFTFTIISCTAVEKRKQENYVLQIKDLSQNWSNWINRKVVDSLKQLYADTVIVDGDTVSKYLAAFEKNVFFKQYPDLKETIVGKISIDSISPSKYKASFKRHLTVKGEINEGTVILVFNKSGSTWKIVEETGQSTKTVSNKKEQKVVPSHCDELITEILKTSPRFKKLTKHLNKSVVKNGGSDFGISLEGSPNPRNDKAWSYSKTYDFTVYEKYPDRQVNIAHFTFSPEDKQLYEYDIASDRLNPIEFNRNLLKNYKDSCW